MNNLYQNYQYHKTTNFFIIEFSKHSKLYQQIMSFIDCIMSTKLYESSKVINSVTIHIIYM